MREEISQTRRKRELEYVITIRKFLKGTIDSNQMMDTICSMKIGTCSNDGKNPIACFLKKTS